MSVPFNQICVPRPRFNKNMAIAPWKRRILGYAQGNSDWWIEQVLGDQLWDKQREIARSIHDNERVAVPAAFGVGKTFLAARLALWFAYNHKPSRVITTAPTNRQVKDLLWSELRTAYRAAHFPLGGEDPLTLQLHIDDDQFAIGFSTKDYNIDYFTGYHAENQLIVFDQASGLPKVFWDAAEGLMTSANCRWLAIGNTAIPDGEFANICLPERKTKYGKWKVIPITALESPNVIAGENIFPGIVSHDWVEKRLDAWGEDDPLYMIFVLAKFVASAQMVVVPMKTQNRMWATEGKMHPTDIEIGLDVARSGVDNTVWTARSGSRGLRIKRVTGNDTMTVVGETKEFIRYIERRYSTKKQRRQVTAVKIDTIGIGAGVYDRCAELDMPVVPVNNAETFSLSNPERFLNVRAEMAWNFREHGEDGLIGLKLIDSDDPTDMDNLGGDIRAIRYKISSSGKIRILEKDEIKQELKRSPDWWDSAVMAFETPGGEASIGVIGTDQEGKVKMEEIREPTEEDVKKLFEETGFPDDEDFAEF